MKNFLLIILNNLSSIYGLFLNKNFFYLIRLKNCISLNCTAEFSGSNKDATSVALHSTVIYGRILMGIVGEDIRETRVLITESEHCIRAYARPPLAVKTENILSCLPRNSNDCLLLYTIIELNSNYLFKIWSK